MSLPVLDSLFWQRPKPVIEIDLRPGHAGDFFATLACQQAVLDEGALLNRIKAYDGAFYPTANGDGRIRLNKNRIESIQFVARSLIAAPDFFQASLPGINCASGFITFGADGQPSQAPHARDQRQRHVLPGRWAAGPLGPR
jgi:hypothetical protein